MDEETVYLLRILKDFVWCGKTEFEEQVNWSKLIELANIHGVTGIVCYMAMNNPRESTAPMMPWIRRQCLSTISLYSRRAEQMKLLIRQMTELGIDHLLFKGYVLREYYPVPELRTFGDIDFLIRPEDREKSHGLMMEDGFQTKNDWEPVYSYYKGTEYYEIHTDVMEVDVSDKADYKGYFKHIWDHAVQTGPHTWELTPEFHFLYLLTHIAKHISGSGAGIRMYMDIAVFIQHFGNTIDWQYIAGELEVLKFTDFANVVLTVVENYFGVESPLPLKMIDGEILNDFMAYTMKGGIFGHVKRDAGLISLKKEKRNEESVSRTAAFLHRLFPSAKQLEKRYTYLQGKHWLLPAAWVHRFFRTKDTWEAHMQEARSIMNTDTEEVLRLKRIYKEIGL